MDIVTQNHSTQCTCSYLHGPCVVLVWSPSLRQGVCIGGKASMPMYLLCGSLSSTSSLYSYEHF